MTTSSAPGPSAVLAAGHRPLGIRRNFVWTACGNLAFALSQWGIVVALAKLLDPAAVGEWTFAFAVATPVFMLSDLQLRTVHVTDAEGRFELGQYVGLRLLGTLATSVGLAVFVLTRSAVGLAALTLLGICAAKAIESVSDILYGVFQKQDRMDLVARSLLLRGPLCLAVLVWALAETRQVYVGAAAVALVWLIVLVAHDIPTAARFVPPRGAGAIPESPAGAGVRALLPHGAGRTLGRLFRVALPLGIVTGLVSLNFNVPRYFLEASHGAAELGVFSAMSYCVMAGGLVVNALGQSVVSRLSRLYSTRDARGFHSLMIKLVSVGLILGGLAIAVAHFGGRLVLEILYGRDYAARPGAFVIVVVGGSIGYVASFLGYGMTAARYFRVQAPLFTALVLLNGVTCLVLVPRLGLVGAALATVVTALGGLVLSLAVNLHALRALRA